MQRGRPKVTISSSELLQLWKGGHTKKYIADHFGISRQTLERVLVDDGIKVFETSGLTDEELDELTIEFKCIMPAAGERLVLGHFRANGYNIQRRRIRQSIQRVDGIGVAERAERVNQRIRRRVYGSPYPHYCWHLDGNHKLIRWGLVIHCAIDGFSRACTYLKCSSNNRATTVLECFTEACDTFQIVPTRVRTDHGGENQKVWEAMLDISAQEDSCNPVTVGSSVHNQRVERFNRDINVHVRQHFGNLFYSLERSDSLDVDNKIHIAALHFVYIPRINHLLVNLQNSHNNHPIRTEHNRTPMQLIERYRHLFTSYNEQQTADRSTPADAIPNNPVTVTLHGPNVIDGDIQQHFNDIDVLSDDGAHGTNIYLAVKETLLRILD